MKTLYAAGLALATLALPLASRAQTGGVRIGTAGTPNASAILDLSPDAATAPKGLLPPRVTLTQRNAIGSPATGLVVYQTDNVPGLYVYNGSIWTLQGDNLGNHTATRNLNLGTNQLVGNGGAQGLAITNSGLVGLGTSTPYSQLANTSTNILGSDGNGGNGDSFAWVSRQIGYAAMIYNSSTAGSAGGLAVKVTTAATGALDVSRGTNQLTPGTSLLRVLGSGNVGIGTSTPSQLLEIGGQAAPTLLLHSTGNGLVNGAMLQFREDDLGYGWNLRHNSGGSEDGITNDRLVLESTNNSLATPVMTWDQGSRNVGIGTTTPAYPLDVTGDARVSGNLSLGFTTVTATIAVPASGAASYIIACPAGTYLLGGGGGYLGTSSGPTADQINVLLNYSGPNPDSPATSWLLRVYNNATTSRNISLTCNCARIR